MSILPDGRPRAHLPPHLEALELRDFNAPDVIPSQEPDAFPPDALTDAEIDAIFVVEMERGTGLQRAQAATATPRARRAGAACTCPSGRG